MCIYLCSEMCWNIVMCSLCCQMCWNIGVCSVQSDVLEHCCVQSV